MESPLLTRLESAIECLLVKNRQLAAECSALKMEKQTWQQERQQLLGDVEKVLTRLDDLQLEEP